MTRRRNKILIAVWHLLFMPGLVLAQIPPEDLLKIEKAVPAKATIKPKQPRKLLVFTRAEGYKHASIP